MEIAHAKRHPTVEEVYACVRRRVPSISLDTVYRTLAAFEKHGLIQKLQILEEPVRYDGTPARHHHLVCKRCKSISDFHWPLFERMRLPGAAAAWGRAEARQVQILGLCRKCLRGAAIGALDGHRLRDNFC